MFLTKRDSNTKTSVEDKLGRVFLITLFEVTVYSFTDRVNDFIIIVYTLKVKEVKVYRCLTVTCNFHSVFAFH